MSQKHPGRPLRQVPRGPGAKPKATKVRRSIDEMSSSQISSAIRQYRKNQCMGHNHRQQTDKPAKRRLTAAEYRERWPEDAERLFKMFKAQKNLSFVPTDEEINEWVDRVLERHTERIKFSPRAVSHG